MLIAQMVGRNEEKRYLPQVLERLKDQVDLICFTDDCSDDGTYELAESYGAKMSRTPRQLFMEDEYALRSFAWQNVEKYAQLGDWILCIDCDEEFFPTPNFSELMAQPHASILGIVFYHMWNDTQYRVDKAWHPNVSSRLFRYLPGGEFRNRKLACGAEPTYVMSFIRDPDFFLGSGLRMKHLGYVGNQDKIDKYHRYMTLDGGSFHNLQHLQSIIDPSPTLVDWED